MAYKPLPSGPVRDKTGLCECGCGGKTKVATRSLSRLGHIKGEPIRFILGHSGGGIRLENPYTVDPVTGCWLWNHNLTTAGYGRYSVGEGRRIYAHRWMYEKVKGPIPENLPLDHKITCPKRCVNPDHLEAVTSQVNVQRGHRAILTPEAVRHIRSCNTPAKELADLYGIGVRQIYYVRGNHTWTNIKIKEVA